MDERDMLAYVEAAAALLALPVQGARARSVAMHLQRTAALARLLEALPLAPHEEPAQLFVPAPFPAEDAP